MVEHVRSKEKIRVIFVLHEVSLWKSEALYLAMRSHERFDPVICVTISNEELPESAIVKFNALIEYLKSKGYEYRQVLHINELNPDITIYSKQYLNLYPRRMGADVNNGIVLNSNYAYSTFHVQLLDTYIMNHAAFVMVENDLVATSFSKLLKSKWKNIYVTGLPMTDLFLKNKEEFVNPWKEQEKSKKRIIWAPHFTIRAKMSCYDFSSFLSFYELMPALAHKYQDLIQVAFKPHPILYPTLIKEWGKERADAYYKMWDDMPNGQCELGEYIGLFKHSDAMIHDCGSFMIEYLYTDNPVLYTLRNNDMQKSYNEFGKLAYDVLYHYKKESDVESFIVDVINDIDPKKQRRLSFKKEHLLPPNNKTACENTIDAILGLNGYR